MIFSMPGFAGSVSTAVDAVPDINDLHATVDNVVTVMHGSGGTGMVWKDPDHVAGGK